METVDVSKHLRPGFNCIAVKVVAYPAYESDAGSNMAPFIRHVLRCRPHAYGGRSLQNRQGPYSCRCNHRIRRLAGCPGSSN